MIIECSYCESKVDGIVLMEHYDPFDLKSSEPPFKVLLLECPVCKNSLVAGQNLIQGGLGEGDNWDSPSRLWPEREKYLDWSIPDSARNSLEEAQKCYKARAYDACAVMSGRVLEGVYKEHGIENKVLAGGLKELLDKQIIDKRIFEWGKALRDHRNIGAHATGIKISKDEAKDLLDFANAICDYVFVLAAKFKRFMERKQLSEKKDKMVTN